MIMNEDETMQVEQLTECHDDVRDDADVKPNEDAANPADEIVDDSPEDNAAPAGPPRGEPVDIDALIAEAEERGYRRGREAGIEAWMKEGAVGLPATDARSGNATAEVMILNNMRRSVWD